MTNDIRVPAGQPTGGQFASHERTEAEVALEPKPELTPRQLGAIGLGPASKNHYMTMLDRPRGRRPFRPFLPLYNADDDEFFDAPLGTQLIVADDAGNETRYLLTGDYEWHKLSDRGVQVGDAITAGELWSTLFSDEDGKMAASKLLMPRGVLYSDPSFYVRTSDVDTPLTPDEAATRLAGTTQQLVSYLTRGDEDTATSDAVICDVVVDDGYVKFTDRQGGVTAVRLDDPSVTCFDRDGFTVIQVSHDAGYGWERVYRKLVVQ